MSFFAQFETDTLIVTIRMESQHRRLRLVIDTGGPDLMLFQSRMSGSTGFQTLGTETVMDSGGSFQRGKLRIPNVYPGQE